MLFSAFLYAASFFLFKFFALQANFWETAFWESLGFILYAVALFICVPSYRREFLSVFPRNKKASGLMILNETINIAGKITFNYFSLWAPITLTWLGVSFQSVFVLMYSVILTKLFPQISQEAITGRLLLQKFFAVSIMLIGACIIYIPESFLSAR
jgi:hypothetical protein